MRENENKFFEMRFLTAVCIQCRVEAYIYLIDSEDVYPVSGDGMLVVLCHMPMKAS